MRSGFFFHILFINEICVDDGPMRIHIIGKNSSIEIYSQYKSFNWNIFSIRNLKQYPKLIARTISPSYYKTERQPLKIFCLQGLLYIRLSIYDSASEFFGTPEQLCRHCCFITTMFATFVIIQLSVTHLHWFLHWK